LLNNTPLVFELLHDVRIASLESLNVGVGLNEAYLRLDKSFVGL
jgi:hypothetical protein